MKKVGLIVLGLMLVIPAILLGPIVKLFPVNTTRPWVDGWFWNTLRAYAKYDTKSWLRRAASIIKMPHLTLQYLTLLTNKQKVVYEGLTTIPVCVLNKGHDVATAHTHHRERVEAAKQGRKITSNYGAAIVVDGVVHDGNHRHAVFQEAGVSEMVVEKWRVV